MLIDQLNLILPSKMGKNDAEDPFNMGMFYTHDSDRIILLRPSEAKTFNSI